MNGNFFIAAITTAAMSAASPSYATIISIDNVNAPGVGFNDPTPATPIAGNNGTTLGQQRLIVLQQAASKWAALLNSSVQIKVRAQMVPLSCSAGEGFLGAAGPIAAAAGFPNAPRANTSYSIAEANSLSGSDLDPGDDDIAASFNLSLGESGCLEGESWWYGIDSSVSPPPNTFVLLAVMIHELGHGLGFTSGVDSTTGSYETTDPPVWADYLFDEQIGLLWRDMTDSQRMTSSVNDPYLVWTGPRTNKQAAAYLNPGNALIINTPPELAGTYDVGKAKFGPNLPTAGITGVVVLVDDGIAGAGGGTTTDGCEAPFVSDVAGKIALIDRGFCNFIVKTKNAQDAGAIGVIFADNVVEPPIDPQIPGPQLTPITIPSYLILEALGASIKSALSTDTVNVTMGYANTAINEGCIRMYAPIPLAQGSSVSHFHVEAVPDLLMEPFLSPTLFDTVDLTLPLFADIDWSTNIEDFIFLDGSDQNPCQHVQP